MPIQLPSVAIVAVLAASVLAGDAFARDAKPDDLEAIRQCLDARTAAREPRESCIGAIADPCLKKGDDPSTMGMADCSRREYFVWDERLNKAYHRLMAELDEDQRRGLRDMQRAWISFFEKKCGFHRVLEPQGTIVIPIMSYCTMREAGLQALFLESQLGDGDSR